MSSSAKQPAAPPVEETPSLYLDILTARTHKTKLVLRLPRDAKPLMASLRLPPECPGLLASYYSPDKHAWVVTRAPQTNTPIIAGRRQTCVMCLELVVLFDRKERYELRVHMAHVAEAATAAAYFDWEEKSLLYRECFTCPADDEPSDALVEYLTSREAIPSLREAVNLAAVLPEKEGFALVGGGFCSHYPVLQFGPGVPQSTEALYEQLLLMDDANAGTMTTLAASSSSGTLPHTTKATTGTTEEELTAWTVTAAPNMGLACFAIGLRKRASNSSGNPTGATLGASGLPEGVLSAAHRTPPLALGFGSSVAQYEEGHLMSPTPDKHTAAEDDDGMVQSRRPSRSVSTRGAKLSIARESPSFSPYSRQRPLSTAIMKEGTDVGAHYAAERDYMLSRLILKQGVRVHHGVSDSLWSLQLPLCEGVSCPLYSRADQIKQTRETYYKK